MNLEKICQKVIDYGFYSLFFLIPLIMTPWNFELFEYNKMMLTYALTAIITAGWIGEMIMQKRIIFKRTAFDLPLLLFFLGQILSTIFSIDRHTSIFGYYSRFHGGLASTISYLLLYYGIVANFDKAKVLTSLRYLLVSALMVSFYGILEHFGIDSRYWVQDVKNRVFSTLGQPNWLAAYLAALLPLPLALAFIHLKKKFLLVFYSSCFFLGFLCLIFTKSRSGIPAAVISLIIFGLILLFTKFWKTKKKFFYLGLVLTFLLLGGVLWLNSKKLPAAFNDYRYIFGLQNTIEVRYQRHGEGGSPSSDIRKIVWRGAYAVFKTYPLFGSGVETFAYSYYNFRPVEHNLISEWDFLYNKAHNEYFNFLATTGAVGLGTYFLFIGWVIVWNLKQIFKSQLEIRLILFSLFSGWLSILITNFFGFSVVVVAIFFFLYPAIAFILSQPEEELKNNQPKDFKNPRESQYLLLGLILLFLLFSLFSLLNMWRADTHYASGSRLNKQGEYILAYNELQKAATQLNANEPVYQDELAWNAANLALILNLQKDPAGSQQMVDLSLTASNQALKTSPRNLNFLRTKTKIFYQLSSLDRKYLQTAYETLLTARKLAPTDAKLTYNQALFEENMGEREKAIKTLEETVTMKTNYLEARYALGLLYGENKQIPKAIEQFEFISQNLVPDYMELSQKLKVWKGQ